MALIPKNIQCVMPFTSSSTIGHWFVLGRMRPEELKIMFCSSIRLVVSPKLKPHIHDLLQASVCPTSIKIYLIQCSDFLTRAKAKGTVIFKIIWKKRFMT